MMGSWNFTVYFHNHQLAYVLYIPPKKHPRKTTENPPLFGALFLLLGVVVVVLTTPRWRITTWWRLKRWPSGAMRRLELLKHQKKDPVGAWGLPTYGTPWENRTYIYVYIYILDPPMAGELGVFSSDVSAFFLSESELMSIYDIPVMFQLVRVIGAMDGLRSFRKKPLTIPIHWRARSSGSNRMSCWKFRINDEDMLGSLGGFTHSMEYSGYREVSNCVTV